ncbi:MAG: hypothetical protein M3N04_02195, partial [Actinomycetota bacterium]|nr:hypothetical protein [Actinomycetota bacterium]
MGKVEVTLRQSFGTQHERKLFRKNRLLGDGAFASLAWIASQGVMAASYDISNGTFAGSVFAGCTFAAAPPPWVFEAGRLAEEAKLLAEMPAGGEVPPLGDLPPGSWLPHAPN